jgi:peptide/nickel transport system substrate-binding protein
VEQTDFIFNANTKKKNNRELLNLKVREAFDHAINRARIASVVFLGTAKPAGSIIPSSTGAWANPAVKPATFDLAKANGLFDALGYKRGSGGIRTAGGHKMAYTVITPTDLTSVNRSFQIIQSDFQKIGVQLTQRALDSSAAFEAISGPNSKYLNFDLAMWDWVALIDPDFMLSVVTCDQYGGWSDSGFCNKQYDAMYTQQQLTPDQAKRRAIVWKMQTYLAKQRPYLWLAALDHVSAHSSKWTGIVNSPQGPFNSLSKLSLTSVHQAG